MARPAILPEFATSGTQRTRPTAFETDGYPYGLAVPSQMHNWQFGVLGDWVEYLDLQATPFPTLAALIDATVPGEYGLVWRKPTTDNAFRYEQQITGTTLRGLACDGKRVFAQVDGALKALDANNLASTLVTYTLSGTGTKVVSHLVCNGTHLLASFEDDSQQRYDLFLLDGTLLGSTTGTVGDSAAVALDGVHAYTCTGNIVQQRLISSNLAGGPVDTYDHTAVITALFLHSKDMVVLGAARTTTSGFATTGDRIVGVLTADMLPIWGTAVAATANSKTDGRRIFYNTTSGIETVGLGNGITSRPVQAVIKDHGASAVDAIGADNRYLYIQATDRLTVHDANDLACLAQLGSTGVASATSGRIVSDNDQVFVATTSGSGFTLSRFTLRSGAPRLFGRQDPANDAKRNHSLLAVSL